jgi:hypothetical protein
MKHNRFQAVHLSHPGRQRLATPNAHPCLRRNPAFYMIFARFHKSESEENAMSREDFA